MAAITFQAQATGADNMNNRRCEQVLLNPRLESGAPAVLTSCWALATPPEPGLAPKSRASIKLMVAGCC